AATPPRSSGAISRSPSPTWLGACMRRRSLQAMPSTNGWIGSAGRAPATALPPGRGARASLRSPSAPPTAATCCRLRANSIAGNGRCCMDLETIRSVGERLKEQLRKVVVGQDAALELLLVSLLSEGHVLLEGVPGVAKTLLARTFAAALS